jgi:hypothetical protein
MANVMAYTKDDKAIGGLVRKKLKTSDLPLASATRAAIEGLAHTFKKKGGYDTLRKQVWDDLVGSVGSKCPKVYEYIELTGYRISRQISQALSSK